MKGRWLQAPRDAAGFGTGVDHADLRRSHSGRNAARRLVARRHVAQEKETRMTTLPSLPEEVHVKYKSVAVFAVPELNATVIDELHPGVPFGVSRQQGLFYAVTLGDGREGFVFARNLAGDGLPARVDRPTD
jgi:hypothetical protein